MLEHLHIENVAVIESADLDFRSGFSVLTGETGAGKSVLIHSLNLLLGERVSKEIVRSGCGKATVSGVFTQLPDSTLQILKEQGFEADSEVLIQRELSVDGRSTVRINGRPATVSMLRDLGGFLINIHGQHDNRALLDPATHIRYLDAFADHGALLAEYESVFLRLKSVLKALSQLNTDEQTRMQRMDLLSYQLEEINRAELRIGEEEELSQRRITLSHGEKIESALSSAYELCSEENGVRDKLSQATSQLERIASLNPALEDISNRFISLSDMLDDLISDLRSASGEFSFDATELDEVEERLDLIYRLKRKYGTSVEEVLAFRDRAQEELDKINGSELAVEELQAEKELLSGQLRSIAKRLTDSRSKAASILEKSVTEALAFLDMPNTGFKVNIHPAGSFTPKGADAVEFLLSANLGESLRPLSKIASGGELSRIMLCMKTVLTSEDDAETLIFDEVDTGVSGKAAEKIAMKLRAISRDKQVIVVTHLAQIAAYADEHFRIEKNVTGNRTYTSVIPLDHQGRIQELARIMGGMNPTSATLAAAEDLLRVGSGENCK